jgi:hypothetical protein
MLCSIYLIAAAGPREAVSDHDFKRHARGMGCAMGCHRGRDAGQH